MKLGSTSAALGAATTIWLAVLVGAIAGETVTLSWDPSPSAGVACYQIHFGTNSGAYQFVTNAGPALTQTVTVPWRGRWYFAATACDTNNVESLFSNEVQWESRPEPPLLHSEPMVRLTLILERSTNLVNWESIVVEPTILVGTNTAEFFRVSRLSIEPVDRPR